VSTEGAHASLPRAVVGLVITAPLVVQLTANGALARYGLAADRVPMTYVRRAQTAKMPRV
jgi:hypothetical protein